jgi:uroporphyrinogen-III synthase
MDLRNADQPLAGETVAMPESRRLDIFAQMLEKRGARVRRCPLVAIHDAPDAGPVEQWIEAVVADQFLEFPDRLE